MGIVQHHDAVTGTARSRVAADYARRVTSAIDSNNVEYTKRIAEAAFLDTGLEMNPSEWRWCNRLNGTFVDCPINDYFGKDQFFVTLALHNPSTAYQKYTAIRVPNGKYDVKGWNKDTASFDTVPSSIYCDPNYLLDNGTVITSCELHIKYTVSPLNFGYVQIKYAKPAEGDKPHLQYGNDRILKNKHVKYEFTHVDEEDRIHFNVERSLGDQYSFSVNLRAYMSNQNTSDNIVSGAYVFSTKNESKEAKSYSYSKFQNFHSYNGQFFLVISYFFTNETWVGGTQYDNSTGVVKMILYDEEEFTRVNVRLQGVPTNPQGMEVTVNFQTMDIDNNNTFYTDSNGLEMQKRRLNYRPTWNLNTTQNASANYYPVNSAIVIRDKDEPVQLTVINDRAQGGSVLEKGRIELM